MDSSSVNQNPCGTDFITTQSPYFLHHSDGPGTILSSSPSFFLWERCNDTILSWLLNALSKDLVENAMFAFIAHEVWIDMQYRFSPSNAPQLYQIQKFLATFPQ
ncbi:hypothetical protein AMTRI_Chr09g37190 [Amborella trichopoda]